MGKMRNLVILFLLLIGCVEEQGIWIHESCSDYDQNLIDAVDKMNEREGEEVIFIEGNKGGSVGSKQENINDDMDYFYCDVYDDIQAMGEASSYRGDIYLYPSNMTREDTLFCTAMHELGHRYLGLGHSDDPDTIMYPLAALDCKDQGRWW